MHSLKEFKEIFDPILKQYLDKRVEEYISQTSDNFIRDFVVYSKQIVLNEGKRLRPYLAYLMYVELGGKNLDKALKLFVALEIFHAFALIHDDIMDRALTRHGVNTVHEYISKKLHKEKRLNNLKLIANSQAILVGDLMFSLSSEIFSIDTGLGTENIQKARAYFYKMVDEVFLGQMLDVDVTTKETVSEKVIEEKTRLKTSRYSCVRPMQIGAHLANPRNDLDDYFEKLGTKVGIAFQMQDDLLDLIGNEKKMHKSILNDISERQHTYFTNFIFTKGSNKQIEFLKSVFGKKVTDKNKDKIRKLFIDSGAIESGKKIIMENLDEAKILIEKSHLSNKCKKAFFDLILIMGNRQS